MASNSQLSHANAVALLGELLDADDRVLIPSGSPDKDPYIDMVSLYRNLLFAALGVPAVDNSAWSGPAAILREHWLEGGFAPDAALANESDPAGKISEVADRGAWLASITDGGAGAITILDGTDGYPGGWLFLKTGGDQNDQINMQMNGLSFQMDVGLPLYFEAKVAVGDVDQTDWFVGLAVANTDITNADADDQVGFKADHVASISYISSKDSSDTSADTGEDFADCDAAAGGAPDLSEAKRLGFYWDGVDELSFYVDGTLIDTINTTDDEICDDECLSPIIAVDASQGAAAEAFYVDYIYVAQFMTTDVISG